MSRETVILYPPQATDDNGDPVGGSVTPLVVSGCKVFPRTSSEEQGYIPLSGWGVLLPTTDATKTVENTWMVSVRGGARQEIIGVPADYQRKGILIYTERVGAVKADA